MTALAKVRNDLEQARNETADLREALHAQESKNMEVRNFYFDTKIRIQSST